MPDMAAGAAEDEAKDKGEEDCGILKDPKDGKSRRLAASGRHKESAVADRDAGADLGNAGSTNKVGTGTAATAPLCCCFS